MPGCPKAWAGIACGYAMGKHGPAGTQRGGGEGRHGALGPPSAVFVSQGYGFSQARWNRDAEGFPDRLWEAEPLGASEWEHKFPSIQKWPVSTRKGISQGAGPRGEGKKF